MNDELATQEASDRSDGDSQRADADATQDVEAQESAARERPTDGPEPAGEADGDDAVALLDSDENARFRDRWAEIQADFVDHPREAVEQADRLVADVTQRLAAQFSEQRTQLERHWEQDEDVSTEDLRVVLTRYRSFFERLLAA